MGETGERKISIRNKEFEYYVTPNVRGLAKGNHPLKLKNLLFGLLLVFFITIITSFLSNLFYGAVMLIILFMVWICFFFKTTVIAVDNNFNRFIEEKDEDLIKVIIAHEYGHRDFFSWPPSTIYIVALFAILLVVFSLSVLSFTLSPFLKLPIMFVIMYVAISSIFLYQQRIEEPKADKYALKLTKDKDLVIRALKACQEYDKVLQPNSNFSKIFPNTHLTYEERIKMIEEA